MPNGNPDQDQQAALELPEKLYGLPLALGIVSQQMRKRQSAVDSFLEMYNKYPDKLFSNEKVNICTLYAHNLTSVWLSGFSTLSAHASLLLGVP